MKKEDLDGLKQAMDPLNRGGAVVLPLMAALALPTLLREREQLLGALRAERDRAAASVAAGTETYCECTVCRQIRDAIAAAES